MRTGPGVAGSSAPLEGGLALAAVQAGQRLSRHWALDRLIRGRIWIALIAFALIGIVTLQLLVLALNADIGRALVRQARLQRENATLSIEASELASGERVEAQAAHLGMQLVPLTSLRFLTSTPRADVARAAAALSAPVQHTSTGAGEASGTAAAPGSSASVPTAQQAGETSAAASTSTSGATEGGAGVGVASQPASAATPAPSTPAPAQAAPTPAATAAAGTTAAEAVTGSSGGVGASAPSGGGQEPGSG